MGSWGITMRQSDYGLDGLEALARKHRKPDVGNQRKGG